MVGDAELVLMLYNKTTAAGQIDTNSAYFVIHETAKENERVSVESCRGRYEEYQIG